MKLPLVLFATFIFAANLALACPHGDCGNKDCEHKQSKTAKQVGDPLSEGHEHAEHNDKFMLKPEGRGSKKIPKMKKAAAEKSAAADQ